MQLELEPTNLASQKVATKAAIHCRIAVTSEFRKYENAKR